MKRNAVMFIFVFLGFAAVSASLPGKQITLPPDVSTLRPSALPGYALARQKCVICHSADYINYQAPGFTQAQWTAEAKKMQHSYGAPLDAQEIKSIGAYLAVAYGSAKATDTSVIAASSAAKTTSGATTVAAIDVHALLRANACLGCHAVDKKVVGPAYRDVAAKYKTQANAQDTLAVSIRNGGIGKWGDVPMPPMSALSQAQAKAVAAYVLAQ